MEENVLTDTITAFYGGNSMGSEEAVAQMQFFFKYYFYFNKNMYICSEY